MRHPFARYPQVMKALRTPVIRILRPDTRSRPHIRAAETRKANARAKVLRKGEELRGEAANV